MRHPSKERGTFDLVIVGGGAYGSALAWEAASRGLSVFLAEKDDFGSGTSANSLKIVHGGLRYLQKLDLQRARASARERSLFLRVAPHLVRPLQCVMPTGGAVGKNRLLLAAGLALNAAVTFDRNRNLARDCRLPAGGLVSKQTLANLAPGLCHHDVSGGALWFDVIMADSERLCLAMVMSARLAGAEVCNYTEVTGFLESQGVVHGVTVRDRFTGNESEILAKAVANCQGPWAFRTIGSASNLGLLKAVNLVIGPVGLGCAVGFPSRSRNDATKKGRLFFAVPWQGVTLVGTWYFRSAFDPQRLSVTSDELDLMLEQANSGFNSWNFKRDDVRALHIGFLPAEANGLACSNPLPMEAPKIIPAEHLNIGRRAWFVQGEKWTTARYTAQRVLELIAQECSFSLTPSVTAEHPLYGGEGLDESTIEAWEKKLAGTPVPGGSIRRLARQYGHWAEEIFSYAASNPALAHVVPGTSDILGVELQYSIRHEMVRTLSDVLLRRTNIGAIGLPSPETIEFAAKLTSDELGWSSTEREQNIKAIYTHPMYRAFKNAQSN